MTINWQIIVTIDDDKFAMANAGTSEQAIEEIGKLERYLEMEAVNEPAIA